MIHFAFLACFGVQLCWAFPSLGLSFTSVGGRSNILTRKCVHAVKMSATSIPLVGIPDAASVTLPLLGPKKNAISGSPIEYCLEVPYNQRTHLNYRFHMVFDVPKAV